MTRSQKTKCRCIAEKYGVRNQEQQAVSELTELQMCLTRRASQRGKAWEDKNKGETWKESLVDEIADVLIMIRQMQELHNITDKDIDAKIDEKLDRQLGRIEKGDAS